MTEESPERPARDQDQMEDKTAFRDDPRGSQQISEQQPETQQSDGGEDRLEGTPEDEPAGETGRDDGGQATGNPPNAG